jgi:hypothetical protein
MWMFILAMPLLMIKVGSYLRGFAKTAISDLEDATILTLILGILFPPNGGKRNQKRPRYLGK